MVEQPGGTVTLVFTDIEGSTRLMRALGESDYRAALTEHRRIVREAFERHAGYEVDYEGDSFFYAFQTAGAAIRAIEEARNGLDDGPITIRVGVHTGSPQVDPPKYVGMAVHQAARIMSAAHGGQVLISGATRELIDHDIALCDLGHHRLKDIDGLVHLFQLGSETFPVPKTLSASNLPLPPTPLLGRDDQLKSAEQRFDSSRLVTITGPGGTGKTRFAVELAARMRDQFADGVVWVPLSAVQDASAVIDTVGHVMGAKVPAAEHIGDKRMLIALDNFEQVVDAAAEVAQLVASCPNLHVLVTSRERLHVDGEAEHPLSPLAIDPAVELFCDRAGIEPSPVVQELCRRLDCLPLALELAATRARIVKPEELLDRLGKRLDLLKGRRDADPRQQTLRATIEWSHDLLHEDERELFAALGVFVGGFTLAAAEAICDADLDVLQSLHDKSLVTVEAGRFGMLETIREFARERFEARADADEISRRHARWYADLAAEAKPALESTGEQTRWLAVLTPELGNLRSALGWSRDNDPATMLVLTGSLGIFFWLGKYHVEALDWIDTSLAVSERLGDEVDGARADACEYGAWLSTYLGQVDRAEKYVDRGADLHRKRGDDRGLARALRERAKIAGNRGDDDAVRALLEESERLSRSAGDGWNLSIALNNLGDLALGQGDFEAGLRLCGESLALRRARGDVWGSAICEVNVGYALIGLGRYDEARRELVTALELADQVDLSILLGQGLVLLAAAELDRDLERAAYLVGASETVFAETAEVLQAYEDEFIVQTINRVKELLTPAEYEAATANGRAATRDEVLRFAADDAVLP